MLKMIGVPATTNSIQELGRSDVIIVNGVDLGRQLPTIGGAVIRAGLNGAKLIVIDTRRHRVAENAGLFLQHKPGTETLLYGAMAKVIVDHGLMDLPFIKAHCRGYEAFLASVDSCDLLATAEICGVPAEKIEEAALAYARAKAATILYSTGIEAGEAESVEAMVNLCLLTGQIGREGAGIFTLTEHNNLQGVCDMGMLPDRLPGYVAVTDDTERKKIEDIWGAEIPTSRGANAKWALSHRGKGTLHAIWLCRYDPISTAFINEAADSLKQCELVVVQHVFPTETANYAHVVLPTALFGEERVTFTSTERRIQLAEQVIAPPEGIDTAWRQFQRVAREMGADWKYGSSAEIMDEIGEVVPFYSGANYDNLAHEYGRQWPCTRERPLGTQFLFAEDQPRQTFTLASHEQQPEAVNTDTEYPLTLIFGHSLYYWNQNVLIRHSETLKREYRILLLDYPDGFIEININDAKRFAIRDHDKVRVRSAGGSAVTAARVTPEVLSGTVYVPYFVSQVLQQVRGPQGSETRLLPVCLERVAE
jgi:predicted molibdopterin-dependent oxidoreductase YjgC